MLERRGYVVHCNVA